MGLKDLVARFVRPEVSAELRVKASASGPMIAWSGVGRPKWTPRRYDQLADQGYVRNVVAYRCVSMIASAVANVPWLLYDKSGQEVETHPLLDLLDQPNPMQDGASFLEALVVNLQTAGNAYIEAVRPDEEDAPTELYLLRPDRMKVIPGPTGLPIGYEYTVDGKVARWSVHPVTGECGILHLRHFHPLDDWYGLAPLEAALLSVDQHNAASAWNQSLLNQGARPSGALVYAPKEGPNTLSDEQVSRLRDEMDQHFTGRRNAGRPLILEGGLEWREMSLSPKEMDWLAGRDAAARDIALAFGVPVQLIGIQGAQTYANMQEARLAFYEETVLPLLSRMVEAFDHWLCPLFDGDLSLDYDEDEVSALTSRRDILWDKLQKVDFLTINEKREALGYGPVEDGDRLGLR
ncbi:MAG: phage portal protein [Proteobacteria bacterium]|jgi:HK97 family phage portal protein|nr:phage portal protein [Alphaproteobacteria bacterium]NCC03362.1 phage portal protein [Pseudomonadota bacterium]